MHCVCSICHDLLANAVTLKTCDHNFCRYCIDEWVASRRTPENIPCPDCREIFSSTRDIETPRRLLRNILADTIIKCSFENCEEVLSYNNYFSHIEKCDYNLNAQICCAFCSEKIIRCKIDEHNAECVQFLNHKISDLEILLKKSLKNLTEANKRESEAKKREKEAKKRETEAKKREIETKKRETEAKKRETDAKKRETEAKRLETKARQLETEAKEREIEAKQLEMKAKQAEKEANHRENLAHNKIIALEAEIEQTNGQNNQKQMMMYVKTLRGIIIPLEVNESDTIKTVKTKIENRKGFLPDKQRLIYAGEELVDHFTLHHYKVQKDSRIYLVLR